MNQTPVSFNSGFTNKNISLRLRMLTVEEDTAFFSRFNDIDLKDPSRADKLYQVKVDALAEWSIGMPTYRDPKEKNEDETFKELAFEGEFEDAAACVKAFFAERTVETDRIAEGAVRAVRNASDPGARFF